MTRKQKLPTKNALIAKLVEALATLPWPTYCVKRREPGPSTSDPIEEYWEMGVQGLAGDTGFTDSQARLDVLFPLPPKREPRVVRDQHGDDWRLNEAHALERRLNMDGAPGWFVWANTARVAIIRDLLASPYIEVPDPEDGPA